MTISSTIQTKIQKRVEFTDYIIGSDLLSDLDNISQIKNKDYSSFLLLADTIVYQLYAKKVISSLKKLGKPIVTSVIPSGEKYKRLEEISQIIKPFFQKGFDRRACLVCLGGGVITDIGGFLASILLRGIDCIYIPTTLLAQIDAAIGGKTGVAFWVSESIMYKNMIGTIKQPNLVISDVDTLATLPEKEILNGLGEMVKYWVGWGKPNLNKILNIKYKKDKNNLIDVVKICQKIKLDIVKKDPFEATGVRQKLNLGHTIGHAIEGASDGKLSHGQAVAIGLVAAARLSVKMKLLKPKIAEEIELAINKLGLPVNAKGINPNNVLSAMKMDKKGGAFVLIKNIGNIESGIRVDPDVINEVINELTS